MRVYVCVCNFLNLLTIQTSDCFGKYSNMFYKVICKFTWSSICFFYECRFLDLF